jgi:hypothetical protein
MNGQPALNKWRVFFVLGLAALLLAFLPPAISRYAGDVAGGGYLPARAEGSSPAEMVQNAWRNAQEAGSYRFISDINQTLIPRPLPEMIGQQETALSLALDGAVVLPDRAYTEMRLAGGDGSESVVLLRDGGRSFMLHDGELKQVDEALNLASQSDDVLAYLAGAEQVTLLEPPAGRPELARYGFEVSGPRFAEYVRRQAEAALRAEPGAPGSLSLQPLPALQQLTGHGELWVDSAGLPVRQVLDLQMPEVSEQYGARIQMLVNLSGYGRVEALPQAVQTPGGAWRLEGTLPALPGHVPAEMADAPAGAVASAEPESIARAETAGSPLAVAVAKVWSPGFSEVVRLQIAPSSLALLILAALASVVIRYYRRNRRRCHALIVLILVPIMLLSTLLRSEQLVRFRERQVEAAETRAAAVPEMLGALGLEMDQATASPAEAAPANGLTLTTATAVALQAPDGGGTLFRCGEGEIGVDTDGDGLDDMVEVCLGTSPYDADTDRDGIPDKVELDGFDLGGKHWDSDPLQPDSNNDGTLDTFEWAGTHAPNGQAANMDLDGDGIPNLWDDDDDGDGVPDRHDLSPAAVTGYTSVANLSTEGGGFNGTQYIEIQVQPEEPEHLRYATTALDWPPDDLGNVQELDDWRSKEDLRLVPFLLVTSNVAPDASLAERYGARSWVDSEGQIIVLAPLSPVQDGGAVHSFYAKVAYGPGQTDDIQWQAKMIWMVQMEADRFGNRLDDWTVVTETRTLHQYQDRFRITGLEITKNQGYEAAVLGTPEPSDDLDLFRMLLGLNDTFKSHVMLERQESGETALEEIASRFGPGSTATITQTFGVTPISVAVSGAAQYGHLDAGLAGLGSDLVPGLLQTYDLYYGGDRCQDAEGNVVSCASLIVAYEQSLGVMGLEDLPLTPAGTVDLSQLHVNLAAVPLLTTRGVQMQMYEQGASGAWQITTPARMLELVEQRYKDAYVTALRDLYPDLDIDDLRFVAYSAYLWATSPSYAAIAVDGRYLVDELADEWQLAVNRALDEELEGAVKTAMDYFGLGTGLVSALGGASGIAWALDDYVSAVTDFKGLSLKSAWTSTGASMFVVASVTSSIMAIINAVCKAGTDVAMCRNQEALKAANFVVNYFGILAQAQTVTSLIIDYAMGTLKALSKVALGAQAVGMVVGVAMAWTTFALALAFGGWQEPIVWRAALITAIVTTIYLIVVFALNFIPIIGQIITAIISLIDMILTFIFSLLGLDQFAGIVALIVNLFYSANVNTSLKTVEFGMFSSGLADPEGGLTGNNVFLLEAPASGVIQKENNGTDDDLLRSYVEGEMVAESVDDGFAGQDMNTERECDIVEGELHCSNTAALGYLLSPRLNGAISFAARMLYQTVWAEYAFYGTVRYKTHTSSGMIPEDGGEATTLYLDVLPATVTELWNWSVLTNPDQDGDGLTDSQEALVLGTSPTLWDTDGDGLSDYYEWFTYDELGADPLKSDTDGDGLSDGLEMLLGTRVDVADTDGDGLLDGEEVRRLENGTMVGGWQVTMPTGESFWVSSDPLRADADGDGLNDAEEKANGLSPYAPNEAVPVLILSATPVRGAPGGRAGTYWLADEAVDIDIRLANGSPRAVTTTLSLDLPAWLVDLHGGELEGDRTPSPWRSGNRLNWTFSGPYALQSYESVQTTITARTGSQFSGSDNISLRLDFGGVAMHKQISAVLDGDDPVVAIMAPADGEYLRGASYVVGGAAWDETTWVTEASLSIVAQGQPADFQALEGGRSPWAYTWEMGAEGVYTLQARATDVMGHQSTTDAINVTVDNTPPQATLEWEVDGNTIRLSGSATDNLSGVEWVRLMIDGQPWRSAALSDSTWSYDWTVGEGAQGEHEVSVRAIDRSGNQSEIIAWEIIVDSVAPASIVNRGADADFPPAVRPNVTFTLTGVADEGGHLPLPAVTADLRLGMDVFDDSTLWLGLSTIYDNDGGVLATWIGDMNADRLADLAVGLPGPEGDPGFVAVLYGRAGGWPAPPDLEMLASSQTRFSGAPGTRLGSLLAAAGDANGDNFSDLLIGERASTRAFLVFGNPGLLGGSTLESGQTGYRVLLQAPATIERLAAAGDVNGDGYDDLLVSAGGTAYLLLGRYGPWPQTLDVAAEAVAELSGVTGALGVGDVNGDQRAEWVTMGANQITLYRWNAGAGLPATVATMSTSDAAPRVVALGDVDGDELADWLYSSGANRILVYGDGTQTDTFASYGGFFAAPGDVDGDGRADILLSTPAGVASLIGKPEGQSLQAFATIAGVGGAANAPYASGADLNSDGSAELLLIPNQAAAERRGFDAPDFSSGFISPQALPLGVSTAAGDSPATDGGEFRASLAFGILAAGVADDRYVDDDGWCDGNSPCYASIQAAVTASDGGGDTITVYPGVYEPFTVPAGSNYDHLTVQGVNADAVFVAGNGIANSTYAIAVAADGVRLSNLTVRDANYGIWLKDGAGEATVAGGLETVIDHVVAHSVRSSILMSQSAALSLSDSTLAGEGNQVYKTIHVNPATGGLHEWSADRAAPLSMEAGGAVLSAGSKLYAVPGGESRQVYASTPGSDGALGAWSEAFTLKHNLPGTGSGDMGTNLLATGGAAMYQLHTNLLWPKLGGISSANNLDTRVYAVAISPVTGDVYVGGRFGSIGGVTASNIARWDGEGWHKVGGADPADNGTNDVVRALVFDNNGNLYVGGDFNMVGGRAVGHVVGWDGSAWFLLGSEGTYTTNDGTVIILNGTDGPVHALAYDPGLSRLYIGGEFMGAYESMGPQGGFKSTAPRENLAIWSIGCIPNPSTTSYCYEVTYPVEMNGPVRSMALGYNNTLYVGGAFSIAGYSSFAAAANNIASYNPYTHYWAPLGAGFTGEVIDLALDPTTSHLYAAVYSAEGMQRWNGSQWSQVPGLNYSVNRPSSIAVDGEGNVYAGTWTYSSIGARLAVQRTGTTGFVTVGYEGGTSANNEYIADMVLDSNGHLYAATNHLFSYSNQPPRSYYGLSRWAIAGFFKRPVSGGSWSRLAYPPTATLWQAPESLAADESGNLYAIWGSYAGGVLYYYDAAANTWTQKANPSSNLALKHLVWAGGKLYAAGHQEGVWTDEAGSYRYSWRFDRYDPATNSWTAMAAPPIPAAYGLTAQPAAVDTGVGLSWSWDGADHIYLLPGDGTSAFRRYRISANAWENLPDPSVSFTVSTGADMARAGSYLYVNEGMTPNLFRYGGLPVSDLRLTVERTAFVMPDVARMTNYWLNLDDAAGSYRFRTEIDTSNAWVGPSSASWSPALPAGAAPLTAAQAAFVAPEDGLYRLGADSQLSAGYHQYKALAHVFPSQAACAECEGGSLTWGDTAFATIREAVESGAARVLVHPGRYPQTFYLVSGVDVIGSGAETTIIEPPAGNPATLVTAEGVARSSLARVTLAGAAGWRGFLAEGGAQGLTLSRNIIRDLATGLLLRQGSQVEVVNNTIVGNTNGLVAEGDNPVNVRNTIFAYNSGTGLRRGEGTTSLSNTYNDFWANGLDMDPVDVGGGKLFRDPRFRSMGADDLRLAADSPLIDKGAPNDPTLPGGGTRVDIGYAEYNAAGFYVSPEYSETGLNDGLMWGIDAFDTIQAGLDAAAAALYGLQGALPEGGYSVGVDEGTYAETVTVPSHVRLIGSGAAVTTIDAGGDGSAATFDGVIDAGVSGFTLQNAGAGGAGVEVGDASSGISIGRNVIRANAGHGVSLAGSSSGAVLFNTIAGNSGAGVYATGSGSWASVRNNILDGNGYGLQAAGCRPDPQRLQPAAQQRRPGRRHRGSQHGDGRPGVCGQRSLCPHGGLAGHRRGRPAGRGASGGRPAGGPGLLGADRQPPDPALRPGDRLHRHRQLWRGFGGVGRGAGERCDAAGDGHAAGDLADADPGRDRPAPILLVAQPEPGHPRPLPGLQPGDGCERERRDGGVRLVRRRLHRRRHRPCPGLGRGPAGQHERRGGPGRSPGDGHAEHRLRDTQRRGPDLLHGERAYRPGQIPC